MNKLACLLILAITSQPLAAEVFKCRLADTTLYQATPCPAQTVSQRVLTLEKQPAEQAAEAQRRLANWEADFTAREAAEKAAQKERAQELAKKAELEALQRVAKAQEEMAAAARQPILVGPPVIINPPYPWFRRPHNHPHGKPPEHAERPNKPPLSTITQH